MDIVESTIRAAQGQVDRQFTKATIAATYSSNVLPGSMDVAESTVRAAEGQVYHYFTDAIMTATDSSNVPSGSMVVGDTAAENAHAQLGLSQSLSDGIFNTAGSSSLSSVVEALEVIH